VETGPEHRIARISEHATGILAPGLIGQCRWDIASDVESEPEKWRQHRATLDAHLRASSWRPTCSLRE
jgi:hypothetical protein